MIRKFKRGRNDKSIFNQCHINLKDLINDHHDYSNEITQKPWGYEYEVFSTESVSIQVLHLNPNSETSFHCHPNKDTCLIILEGEALCKLGLDQYGLYPDDTLLIGKGVFHRTTTLLNPVTLIEIETPNNKNDLVRFQDSNGRI